MKWSHSKKDGQFMSVSSILVPAGDCVFGRKLVLGDWVDCTKGGMEITHRENTWGFSGKNKEGYHHGNVLTNEDLNKPPTFQLQQQPEIEILGAGGTG